MSDLDSLLNESGSDVRPRAKAHPYVLVVMIVGLGAGVVGAGITAWLMSDLPYRHDPEAARQVIQVLLFPFGNDLILATGLFRVPASMTTNNPVGALLTIPFGFLLSLPITVTYGVLLATTGALLVYCTRRLARVIWR